MCKESHCADGSQYVASLESHWSQLATFTNAVESEIAKWLGDKYGLGLTEYYAALLLDKSQSKELRLNDLAIQVGLNQSSVTRLVNRMEAKGLVSKDVCPDDGRGVYAVLTKTGSEVLLSVREMYTAKLGEVVRSSAQVLSQSGEVTVIDSLYMVANFIK